VRGILVSQSAEDEGLSETVDALRHFGAADVPLYAVPRLVGDPENRWRTAPPLTHVFEVEDD
jgi:hypothetical protein